MNPIPPPLKPLRIPPKWFVFQNRLYDPATLDFSRSEDREFYETNILDEGLLTLHHKATDVWVHLDWDSPGNFDGAFRLWIYRCRNADTAHPDCKELLNFSSPDLDETVCRTEHWLAEDFFTAAQDFQGVLTFNF